MCQTYEQISSVKLAPIHSYRCRIAVEFVWVRVRVSKIIIVEYSRMV